MTGAAGAAVAVPRAGGATAGVAAVGGAADGGDAVFDAAAGGSTAMSRGSGPRKRQAAARLVHSVDRQRESEQVASERREVAEGGMARLS